MFRIDILIIIIIIVIIIIIKFSKIVIYKTTPETEAAYGGDVPPEKLG